MDVNITPWLYAFGFLGVFIVSIVVFFFAIRKFRQKNYKIAMLLVILALILILGDMMYYMYCKIVYGPYLGF